MKISTADDAIRVLERWRKKKRTMRSYKVEPPDYRDRAWGQLLEPYAFQFHVTGTTPSAVLKKLARRAAKEMRD